MTLIIPVTRNNIFHYSLGRKWSGRTQVCREWLLPHHRDVRPYKWNFYAALNFLNYFGYLVRLSHLPLNFDFCLLHINLIVFVTLGFLFMQLGKGL